MASFLLNPSRLARYFYHECDRYLRYHATPKDLRAQQGVPPLPEQTPVTEALLEGGYEWEETVVQGLEGLVRIGPGPGLLRDRFHSPASSVRQLETLEVGEAVYQATLLPPPSFLARYNISPELAHFVPCRPDLIVRVDAQERGRPLLRVVDVKASDALKASHRAQVALYAWILRDVVAEAGLDVDVDVEQGGVWLFGAQQPSWFPLGTVSGVLERFLRERLAEVLSMRREDVPWHLFYRCEWCEFFSHCKAEAELTRSVSLLPYLSVKARSYLREAPWGGPPIKTLGELAQLALSPDGEQKLTGSASLRGRAARLARGAEAIERGRVVPHGGASVSMPAREGVRIVITLQRDPVSGRIYAAGFARIMGRDIYGAGSDVQVFVAPSLDACADVQRDFLRGLHGLLSRLHRYNELQSRREGRRSLQTYVFDSYELDLFEEMLRAALSDEELAPVAMPLLRYYHGAGRGDGGTSTEVPYAVVVLTRVLRELFAMPSPIALSLERASQALPSPEYSFSYSPSPGTTFSLSNALRSDVIFQAWYRGEREALERVRGELRNRLLAASGVVDGIRARAGASLFAWPARFELHEPHVFRHAELGRLALWVQQACFQEALGVRERRALPWDERVRQGVAVRLVAQADGVFLVEGEVAPSELEPDAGHAEHLLVADSPEGERAQLSFDDHRHRATFWLGRGNVRLASIEQTAVDPQRGFCERVHLSVKTGKDQPAIAPDERLVLYPRFTDFTSDRIVDRLGQLDALDDSDFLRLLRDPSTFDAPVIEPSEVTANVQAHLAAASLTPSQQGALERLLARRLLVVWGPPGTGKTYFLARAIVLLIEARRQAGLAMRVCVTAFTHAAIEHLLGAIAQAASQLGVQVAVAKLGDIKAQGSKLKKISIARVSKGGPGEASVLGATVYELRRAAEQGMPPCDLLVVDEASQMRLGELSLAMMVLGEGARLVLAGDDEQLPPLSQGRESVSSRADERDVQLSAFAYVQKACGEAWNCTRQLVENFRMNEALCGFPAKTLYGEHYRPLGRSVAERQLQLAERPWTGPHAELAQWALDPAFSMVLCMLEGGDASAENRDEAQLVAMLAASLRERLLIEGQPLADTAEGDDRFWSEGLLIIGPHHAQNRAVRSALGTVRAWHCPSQVMTVEKVQGQQAECALVSYGVSDAETAVAEGAFLYSRNRLNVATTRARSKCVLFLPRPLLDAPFELLGSEVAAEGLAHMHALLSFCQARGERREFALGDGRKLVGVRAK